MCVCFYYRHNRELLIFRVIHQIIPQLLRFIWRLRGPRVEYSAPQTSLNIQRVYHRTGIFIFTSRSFSLSASRSAIRFLRSSSSFRASLVSVRSLSSFRILRIFLRPFRPSASSSSSPSSSPSCSSPSSSPLCENEH